jgi:23S rRNA pseudouridine1911/1915/1917 synthase
LTVDPREDGLTVEALLTGRGELPAAVFREVLSHGGVMLNRRRVALAEQAVRARDELVAHVLARGAPAQGPAPLDDSRILLMDDQVIVVDKPPGVPAQGTEVDASAGLDAALRAMLIRQGHRSPFVGLVHRLDVETSGVTLFGRTPEAVTALTERFRHGEVRKRYVALVSGQPAWVEKAVDGPISADANKLGAYCISSRGRPARSDFKVVEDHGAFAKVEVRPQTGRTHQIRVHAQSLGHALLGDRRYGGPAFLTTRAGARIEVPRVSLHAAELQCRHPSGANLHVHSPWPEDLARVEELWRSAAG